MASAGHDDGSFFPSNERLINFYLRAKHDGRLSDLGDKAAYFFEADVCSAHPEELVHAHSMPAHVQKIQAGEGKQWYFFSPARFVCPESKTRRSRTIDGTNAKECWHAEGRPIPVKVKMPEGKDCVIGFMTKLSYHVKIGGDADEKPGWIMTEYSTTGNRDMVLCKVYKSPRGPGRSCKRKAAHDLEAAAPSSSRPRMTDHEDYVVYTGEIEHQLLPSSVSAEHHVAAPEIVEHMHSFEESHQPEPQFAWASTDELENWLMNDVVSDELLLPCSDDEPAPPATSIPADWEMYLEDANFQLQSVQHVPQFGQTHNVEVEGSQPEPYIVPEMEQVQSADDLHAWMMTDVEDDGTTFPVRNGEDFMRSLFGDNEDATIQTVHGPLTDYGMIAALAAGVTVDELLPSPVSVCVPAPAMPPQPALATATRVIDENDLLSAEENQPEFTVKQNVVESQMEPQIVAASLDGDITPLEVQDWMVADVVEGQDFEAYCKGFWDGIQC